MTPAQQSRAEWETLLLDMGLDCWPTESVVQALQRHDATDRFVDFLESHPDAMAQVQSHQDWGFWGRMSQLGPEDPDRKFWLVMAGRGWGKSASGAAWVHGRVVSGSRVGAIVAATTADFERYCLPALATYFPAIDGEFNSKTNELHFPGYPGVVWYVYTAEKPERLRGGNLDSMWLDEVGSYRYPEILLQLDMALRAHVVGLKLQVCATFTPRRTRVVRQLLAEPDKCVTRGHTLENKDNLASGWAEQMTAKYAATARGREELEGQMLPDNEGALWSLDMIERHRVRVEWDEKTAQYVHINLPRYKRIFVGLDPKAYDWSKGRDSAGIVAAAEGDDGDYYVIADCTVEAQQGVPLSAAVWCHAAADLALRLERDHGKIVTLGYENNRGGAIVRELVGARLKAAKSHVRLLATKHPGTKIARAEPVADVLYRAGRVHHVGVFGPLEDQMCTYDGRGNSPDRLDALVSALTEMDGLAIPDGPPEIGRLAPQPVPRIAPTQRQI